MKKSSMKAPFIIMLFLCLGISLSAQSRSELEKKRKTVNSQIHKTNSKLVKTKSSRKSTLQQLKELKEQILSRQEMIDILSGNIDTLNLSIDRKLIVVGQLEEDLYKLKANYKKIIRHLYRQKVGGTTLSFLFSPSGFNKKFQQWIYLHHLREHKTLEASYVSGTQENLSKSINKLENQKSDNMELLASEMEQQSSISKEIEDKGKKVSALKKQEKKLRNDLKRKKRYKTQMSKKIEQIIHNQIAKAKREARKRKKPKPKPKPKTKKKAKPKPGKPGQANTTKKNKTPYKESSNSAFASQKGKLISPVYQGKISGRFGRSRHPNIKDVYIYNNGIDIRGQYNSVIRNVFEGIVVDIFTVPGQNNAVMLRHGDYFTTYSNIAKVYVKKGEKLRTGGQIGTIGRDTNAGGYFMHFEIWRNKNKENPELWIK